MELAARHFVFDAVEVSCNGINSGGVAYKNHSISKKLGFQVEVETGAIAIDDELGFGKMSFCHSITCY
jgi:hypothetical protein